MFELKRKKVLQASTNSIAHEAAKKQEYSLTPILKYVFHVNDTINFNILFYNDMEEVSILLKSGTLIDKEDKQKIDEAETLYVSEDEKYKYDFFLEYYQVKILKDNSLTLDEKTDLLYKSSAQLTNSLFDNPYSPQNIERSEKIITPILQTIIHNEDTIASYLKIIEYDYYTHTHSLNVSIYSLSLGAELGLNENKMVSLGKSALLHDLGKSEIQHSIVNKQGKLSINECKIMESHPELGHKIALKLGIINRDILDGIRHHHEKLDGMGYPDSLMGDEITLFPRIIGICDIFDALTTRRSYKNAMHSYDALYMMKHQMSKQLDTNILDSFIKMLHA